jgi:predicted SAM-dependent methyltransferase
LCTRGATDRSVRAGCLSANGCRVDAAFQVCAARLGKTSALVATDQRLMLRRFADVFKGAWRVIQRLRFRAAAPSAIADYLQSNPTRKLHIGCGPHAPAGWLNVDVDGSNPSAVYLDCTKPLAFPDQSFMYLFCEHLIEHLTYEQGRALLREAFRVLQPGGRIRIATPDLAILIALYHSEKTPLQQKYIAWSAEKWPGVALPRDVFVINNFFRAWGHQFIYDRKTLEEALVDSGFTSIASYECGRSDDPVLARMERHGEAITEEFNELETFVLEGQRPIR